MQLCRKLDTDFKAALGTKLLQRPVFVFKGVPQKGGGGGEKDQSVNHRNAGYFNSCQLSLSPCDLFLGYITFFQYYKNISGIVKLAA